MLNAFFFAASTCSLKYAWLWFSDLTMDSTGSHENGLYLVAFSTSSRAGKFGMTARVDYMEVSCDIDCSSHHQT